jgi:hypothetical protein
MRRNGPVFDVLVDVMTMLCHAYRNDIFGLAYVLLLTFPTRDNVYHITAEAVHVTIDREGLTIVT